MTPEQLTDHLTHGETTSRETVGTMLLRNTYHYWFHTGEVSCRALRSWVTIRPAAVCGEYGNCRLPGRTFLKLNRTK
ncbi:MAG: hypothetical protein H6656_10215 [Ardenticatenaceae bacterium]|nr:hypothetical protein [Ardenticatenaceae bacterium]